MLGALLLIGPAGAAAERPNIVFIIADDLGYGDLGCNGQTEILTPNIDRLAAQGTRFTQVYAGAAVCAPSRCVLMTGLHTGHARVRDNHGERATVPASEKGQKGRIPLEPDDLTIAEFLQIGRIRHGHLRQVGTRRTGLHRRSQSPGLRPVAGVSEPGSCSRLLHSVPLAERERSFRSPPTKGDVAASTCMTCSPSGLSSSSRRTRTGRSSCTSPSRSRMRTMKSPISGRYADKPWSDLEKTYAAMVTRMDGEVGRILDRLRERDLEESTIVFFCSDNGAPGVTDKSRFQQRLRLPRSERDVLRRGASGCR